MSIHCVYWLKLDSGMSCQRHFPPIPHTLRTYARTSCHYDLIFQPKKKPQKYSTCYLQFNQVYMCFWSSAFSPFKSCSKLPFHAHISNKFMDSESDVEEEKTHINRFAKKESWRSRLADCRKTKACEMKNRFKCFFSRLHRIIFFLRFRFVLQNIPNKNRYSVEIPLSAELKSLVKTYWTVRVRESQLHFASGYILWLDSETHIDFLCRP